MFASSQLATWSEAKADQIRQMVGYVLDADVPSLYVTDDTSRPSHMLVVRKFKKQKVKIQVIEEQLSEI